MKAMQHSWGSLTRLAQDRQRWRDFVAALMMMMITEGRKKKSDEMTRKEDGGMI